MVEEHIYPPSLTADGFRAGTTGGVFKCQADNCILYYNANVDFSPTCNNSALLLHILLPATNGFFDDYQRFPLFAKQRKLMIFTSNPPLPASIQAIIFMFLPLPISTATRAFRAARWFIGAYEYQNATSQLFPTRAASSNMACQRMVPWILTNGRLRPSTLSRLGCQPNPGLQPQSCHAAH